MTILRIAPARVAACFATALVLLVLASTADAAVFCVKDPACPAGGFPLNTPEEALTAADADWLEDTVRLGPGSYDNFGLSSAKPVDIVGAGIHKTILSDTDGGTALYLDNAASSVTGLTVLPIVPDSRGVQLGSGADATDVSVVAPDQVDGVDGFQAFAPGSVLQGIEVDVPDGDHSIGVFATENTWVRDAKITASTGVDGAVSVRRAIIRANRGLLARAHPVNAANVLITRHPRSTSNDFTGLYVKHVNGANAEVTASNLTVDGAGVGTGIQVESGTQGTSSATVTGAIIRNVPTAIHRWGLTAPATANVSISYSSYDDAKVTSAGDGALTQGAGNLTNGPDPRFVDSAQGDYRLRYDSPLIDMGRPLATVGEENPDLAGRERVRDSDGNGSAIRDIGAYEYQRLAPAAVDFTPPGQPILSGDPFTFSATTVIDPDGDDLSYDWTFGDGATASGATAPHAYASAGSYAVTLTATDPTGLSATAAHDASVVAAPQEAQPGQPASSPKITLAKPRCAGGACRLRGTVENATRVRVTIARRHAKPRTVRATVNAGRWVLRVRNLRPGATTFTARARAADGLTAKAVRKIKLR